MCDHTCACLPLTHSRRHNTFAEIKWLQCMTHFAEAGLCFYNDGECVCVCCVNTWVYECITTILQQDDAAQQAFKSWKGSARLVSCENAPVTRPVIMPLAILTTLPAGGFGQASSFWKYSQISRKEEALFSGKKNKKSWAWGALCNTLHVP